MKHVSIEAVLAEVLQPRLFRHFLQCSKDSGRGVGQWLWLYLMPEFMPENGPARCVYVVSPGYPPFDGRVLPALMIDGDYYPLPQWAKRLASTHDDEYLSASAMVAALDATLRSLEGSA